MSETQDREREFKRNSELEEYLSKINNALSLGEKNLLGEKIIEYPVLFVMGPPRSGTTLMTQWLADTGEFSYPTNLLSRFYGAPILGAMIQRILTDQKYNFRNEILDFNSKIDYLSENGKTKGALSPNEFWYLWRRFLPEDIEDLSSEELLKKTDVSEMKKEFLGIANVFEKPFICKGMICDFHIPFLNAVFEKCLFICMERNIDNNTRSLYKARIRQYGSAEHWYSFKTPNYNDLITIKDPYDQVRAQISTIQNGIREGLAEVPDNKKMSVVYEDFCKDPEKTYQILSEKLGSQGWNIGEYKGITSFEAR